MESVRSNRRHGTRGGKRLCGLCLIGKIVPLYLKLSFRKFVYGLGSARSASIFLRLQFILVSLSFTKELLSWRADRSLRILYMRVAFVWKRLVSRVFHFKLFNASTDLTSYEEPVITLPARF